MTTNKKGSVLLLVAALAAVVGLVIYLITSMTGYLAGSAANMMPVVCTAIGAVVLIAVWMTGDKFSPLIRDILIIAAAALIIVSFTLFTLARVSLAADVYFIPVNYPAAEETALKISIGGMVAYVISVLLVVIDGLFGKK